MYIVEVNVGPLKGLSLFLSLCTNVYLRLNNNNLGTNPPEPSRSTTSRKSKKAAVVTKEEDEDVGGMRRWKETLGRRDGEKREAE